jgi:beta-galactosidase/beta-glucuronidase
VTGGERVALNDSSWRKLGLPHDWSIEGPYGDKNASGTGLLPGGIGWYRKTFRLPETARGKKISIEFDGVYRDSDVWIEGWNAGTPGTAGYHEDFDKWGVRDLQDMVLRDRNHPAIILGSIGNEIDYPGDPFGQPFGRNGLKPGMPSADVLPAIARRLIGALKTLDGSRPVTQALADIQASNATGLANLLDVVGYNYLEQHYAEDH